MATKIFHDDSDSEELGRSTTCGNRRSPDTDEVRHAYKLDEELVGNVSKYIAYPPGRKSKLQRGYLMFHACFQSGNLGRVDCVSDFEYDLFIRPDTCNPQYRVWFNFTVQNVVSGQKVIFNIVNFSKTKSLYREGMSPVVKSTSRPKWQRIPPKNVFYYKSPDHHKNYVMSFAFAFDRETDVYQFSYCYPYTYNRLQSYLDDIEKMSLKYVKREQLCLSVQQRNIDLLTITSQHNLHEDAKRHVVFFTARVHPGESPASYVCQGIIDFLICSHPAAQALRDNLIFMIIPMLNPDGVVLGNYRCSLMGFDLNRYWHDPSPWAHPSIIAAKQLLLEMNEDPAVSLDFYIDVHAHSTAMNGFMYGNVYEEEERLEQHSIFPKLLCSNAEDFSYNNTSFNRDAIKAGTGRRTLGSCLSDQSNCYTLEVSFYSYMSGCSANVPYTEEAYLKLGRNVARTFLDYYKLNYVVAQRFKKSVFHNDIVLTTNSKKKTTEGKSSNYKVKTMERRTSITNKARRNSWSVSKRNADTTDMVSLKQSYAQLKLKHGNNKI